MYVQVNNYIDFIIKHVPSAQVREKLIRRASLKRPNPFQYARNGAKFYKIILEFSVIFIWCLVYLSKLVK